MRLATLPPRHPNGSPFRAWSPFSGSGPATRRRRAIALLPLAAILLQRRQVDAQAGKDSTLLHAARVIISAAKYATFITLDRSGAPQSRTVQPGEPDSAMVVRFATNPRSRKVGEVARDARVSLHYFDPGSLAYVALVGRARIIRNSAEKARYWNPAWSAFYPDRDTSVVLIEVTPQRLEVVDIKRGINGDPVTWRAPSVPLRGKPPSHPPRETR